MKSVRIVAATLAMAAVIVSGCSTRTGDPVVGLPAPVSPTDADRTPTEVVVPTDGGTAVDWQRIEVTVATGSVPPPYNHVWWVRIDPKDPERSTLTWRTNYAAEDQEWSTTFAADVDALPVLFEIAARLDDSDFVPGSLAGGGLYGLLIVEADGTEDITTLGSSQESASAGQELADAARATIPDASFEELESQYQAWADAQE